MKSKQVLLVILGILLALGCASCLANCDTDYEQKKYNEIVDIYKNPHFSAGK